MTYMLWSAVLVIRNPFECFVQNVHLVHQLSLLSCLPTKPDPLHCPAYASIPLLRSERVFLFRQKQKTTGQEMTPGLQCCKRFFLW